MKPSAPVGSWQQQTLVEAIRLRETLWGPLEDLSESRRARAAGGSFARRVTARALALAQRDGLEQAWSRWWRVARLLMVAMAVLAVLAGAATAAGALGDGRRAVNVVTAVGALLGLHVLTFIFWLLSLALSGKTTGAGSWAGDLWWWLSRRFVKGEASLVPQAFAAVLARRGTQFWLAGLISHGLWVLAFLSALGTLLLLLASRRYHFNWETTLLTPETFVWLVEGLGVLPSLLGFTLPDTLTIRSSDGLHMLDAQAQALWSSWLLGVVVTYGLLPRVLALAWSLWQWRTHTARLSLDDSLPGLAELRPRLMPVSEPTGVDELASPDKVARIHNEPGALLAAHALCVVGLELPPEHRWPPAFIQEDMQDLGRVDSRAERLAILGRLQSASPRHLLMVCDAAQTPDRGVVATLVEWAQLAQQSDVILLDEALADPEQARRRSWHERLVAAGFAPGQIHDQWPDRPLKEPS
ncbi:DUF2868 domain-containing protein [Alcaligenes ammonioxydans]|uniref:DUF2868 domain-containing protein n=1 Tax=Alcaligenes ammonioxydans TaxID=2582914 RepID=UPI001F05493B|nr:DUF2868 domain-containing protein [Alcaligenes ammonioxydans]MCH1880116.1 DUF2868 domain-containing protein [Alcaligenes ammonioxydans]